VASLKRNANGECLVTLKAPDTVPIMTLAKSEEARKRLGSALASKCEAENSPIFEEVLSLRRQAAKALGQPSWAHRELAQQMTATPELAIEFLRTLLDRLGPLQENDISILRKLKSQSGTSTDLGMWDIAFFSQLHKQSLGVSELEVRQYFPLTHVVSASLDLYAQLFSLTFTRAAADDADVPVWHEEVEAYAVHDAESGELQGYLYLDLFPRAGKYSHQCVYPLRPGYVRADGSRSTSACVMVANLSRASSDGTPALLRWREVETFLHELGHCVHCVSTRPTYSTFAWAWSSVPWIAGVETDFLEVPSMLMENWAYDPRVLARLSCHHLTGEALPEALQADIIKTRDVLAGLARRRYLLLALYDLAAHSRSADDAAYEWNGTAHATIEELYTAMFDDIVGLPADAGFPPASWLHPMMGYSAAYFSYIKSESVAADILTTFGDDLLDEALGKKLRAALLAPGGSQSGADMLETFLGRAPSPEPFLRRLTNTNA